MAAPSLAGGTLAGLSCKAVCSYVGAMINGTTAGG